jgi:hypothetical protein
LSTSSLGDNLDLPADLDMKDDNAFFDTMVTTAEKINITELVPPVSQTVAFPGTYDVTLHDLIEDANQAVESIYRRKYLTDDAILAV